jgi:hypothetical protein
VEEDTSHVSAGRVDVHVSEDQEGMYGYFGGRRRRYFEWVGRTRRRGRRGGRGRRLRGWPERQLWVVRGRVLVFMVMWVGFISFGRGGERARSFRLSSPCMVVFCFMVVFRDREYQRGGGPRSKVQVVVKGVHKDPLDVFKTRGCSRRIT